MFNGCEHDTLICKSSHGISECWMLISTFFGQAFDPGISATCPVTAWLSKRWGVWMSWDFENHHWFQVVRLHPKQNSTRSVRWPPSHFSNHNLFPCNVWIAKTSLGMASFHRSPNITQNDHTSPTGWCKWWCSTYFCDDQKGHLANPIDPPKSHLHLARTQEDLINNHQDPPIAVVLQATHD